MNKTKDDILISFFLAPLTALFMPKVYRDAATGSWRKGVLYTVYGALIITAFVMAIFLERAATSDKFILWLKDNAPVVIWTPAGLSLEDGQKTARLTHPVYGPVAAFDMDREIVTEEDVGDLFVFVTSKRIVFRKMLGELEDRDVTKIKLGNQNSLPAKVRVSGQLIASFYHAGKMMFLSASLIVIFILSLTALLLTNGLFSLTGVLLNELVRRSQKLSFSGVLNLACFSSGTSLVVLGVILIGFVFSRPLPIWLIPAGLLISLVYMIVAVVFVNKQDRNELPKPPSATSTISPRPDETL